MLSYDLEEYTRFNTVGKTFLEFVRRILVRRINGVRRISIYSEQPNSSTGVTRWPCWTACPSSTTKIC